MNLATSSRHRLVVPSVCLLLRPEPDAPVDTQILFGEDVYVLSQKENGFTQVYGPTDDKTAWVRFTRADFEPVGESTLPPPTHWVKSLSAEMFSLNKQVGMLSMNSRVSVGKTIDSRTQVQCVAGGSVWVWSRHLAPIGDYAPDFVSVQQKFLGCPYGWGMRDGNPSIDCSALVHQSLLATGYDGCPRDSVDQRKALAVAIDPLGPLARGDLVFWRGHVATMTSRERLIHATGLPHSCVLYQSLEEVVRERLEAGKGPIQEVRRFPNYQFR